MTLNRELFDKYAFVSYTHLCGKEDQIHYPGWNFSTCHISFKRSKCVVETHTKNVHLKSFIILLFGGKSTRWPPRPLFLCLTRLYKAKYSCLAQYFIDSVLFHPKSRHLCLHFEIFRVQNNQPENILSCFLLHKQEYLRIFLTQAVFPQKQPV